MPNKLVHHERALMRKIPLEVRPAIIDWLHATRRKSVDTCADLRHANKKLCDETTEKTAAYWEAVGRACALLAYRLSRALQTRTPNKVDSDDASTGSD